MFMATCAGVPVVVSAGLPPDRALGAIPSAVKWYTAFAASGSAVRMLRRSVLVAFPAGLESQTVHSIAP